MLSQEFVFTIVFIVKDVVPTDIKQKLPSIPIKMEPITLTQKTPIIQLSINSFEKGVPILILVLLTFFSYASIYFTPPCSQSLLQDILHMPFSISFSIPSVIDYLQCLSRTPYSKNELWDLNYNTIEIQQVHCLPPIFDGDIILASSSKLQNVWDPSIAKMIFAHYLFNLQISCKMKLYRMLIQ